MKNHSFSRFLTGGLRAIACCVCILLLLLNLFYLSEVGYESENLEEVTIQRCFADSVVMVAAAAAVLLIGSFLHLPTWLKEKLFFGILTLIYTRMALYLILNSDITLRTDARSVYRAARSFLLGDNWAFAADGYLHWYPHQLGLFLYDVLLLRFFHSIYALFFANFLWVIGINYVLYRISDVLFQSRSINFLTIGLSFLFLPQFFFILFAYGLIPGLFFLLLSFYYGLKFAGSRRNCHLAVMVMSGSIAVLLRKNYAIGMIALSIFLLLKGLERGKRGKYFLAACMMVLCCVLPGNIVTACMEAKTDSCLSEGVPTVLWIAMGTDMDNWERGPGWYNGFSLDTYKESGFDPEVSAEWGREKLRENVANMARNPRRALDFLKSKLISTWCDPLYQSVWSGPLNEAGQPAGTAFLSSLYSGGRVEDLLCIFCKWITLVLWLFACGFILFFHKQQPDWKLFYLYCIGGVLFHLIWETKSQYVYPYLFCLIPFAACGMQRTIMRIRGLRTKTGIL